MRASRPYLSILMLAIMAFSAVPKEFIHDLCGHTDTVEDIYCQKGVLHVDTVHHHCEILNYVAFPYEGGSSAYILEPLPAFEKTYSNQEYVFVEKNTYNHSPSRAPPVG